MSHTSNDQVIDRIFDLREIVRAIQDDLKVAAACGNAALESDLLAELALYAKELTELEAYF